MKKNVLVIVIALLIILLFSTQIMSASAWGIGYGDNSPSNNVYDTHWEITEEALSDEDVNNGVGYWSIKHYSWYTDEEDGEYRFWHYMPFLPTMVDTEVFLAHSKVKFKKKHYHIWPCLRIPYWVLEKDYAARKRNIGRASHFLEDAGQPGHGSAALIQAPWHLEFENYVDRYWSDRNFQYAANIAPTWVPAGSPSKLTNLLASTVSTQTESLTAAWAYYKLTGDHWILDAIIKWVLIWATAGAVKSLYKYNIEPITSLSEASRLLGVIQEYNKALLGEDITVTYDFFNETRDETVLIGAPEELPVNVFYDPVTNTTVEHPQMAPIIFFLEPSVAQPDEVVEIGVVIGNWGANATNVEVQLLIDNIPMDSKEINLARVSGEMVSWLWKAEYGNHTARVIVDPDKLIDESSTVENETVPNKDDNVLTTEIIVDNMAPEVTIFSPQTKYYLQTDTITLDFTAIDDFVVAALYGYLDGNKSNVVFSGQQISFSDFTLGAHTITAVATDTSNNTSTKTATFHVISPLPVGGIWVPVDKLGLLAPCIALVSTIVVATAATAMYVKHVKRREEKQ